jgi:hypothetical protein
MRAVPDFFIGLKVLTPEAARAHNSPKSSYMAFAYPCFWGEQQTSGLLGAAFFMVAIRLADSLAAFLSELA